MIPAIFVFVNSVTMSAIMIIYLRLNFNIESSEPTEIPKP